MGGWDIYAKGTIVYNGTLYEVDNNNGIEITSYISNYTSVYYPVNNPYA